MAGDRYKNTDDTIKIDETSLKRLQGEYEDLSAEFKKRADSYPWSTTADVSIEYPFYLKLGGASFEEAQALVKKLEKVRTNLAERFDLTYKDSEGLASGIKSLLADTDAVEELNGMTADEFGTFVQGAADVTLSPSNGS